MSKCPNCGEKINKLDVTSRGSISWDFSLSDSGYCMYENLFIGDDFDGNSYRCPECGEELFVEEEDAEAFLIGGQNEKS